MKNLILAFASILAFTFSNDLYAQPANQKEMTDMETAKGASAEEVAVLTNFKANKTQKRVIRKIKKSSNKFVLNIPKNTTNFLQF